MIKHLRKQVHQYKEINQDEVVRLFNEVDEHLFSIIWYGLFQKEGEKILIKWVSKWLGGYYNKWILPINKDPKRESINIGFKDNFKSKDISYLIGLIENLRKRKKRRVFKILKTVRIHRWFIHEIVLDYMKDTVDGSAIMKDHYDKYIVLKDRIQKAYTRVVLKETARISNKNIEHFKDNFQNGCIGLDNAFLRYNQHINVTYGSFAYTWVRQAIMIIMKENSGMIKLPSNMWEIFYKIEQIKSKNPKISVKDIATKIGSSPKRVKEIIQHIDDSRTKSLNFNVGENTQLYEILINEETKDMDTSFLDGLKPWHRKLLVLNYGLYDILD